MATPFYETMDEQISKELQFDYGYRKLHSAVRITNMQDENVFIVPHESYLSKYKSLLQEHLYSIELDDQQWEHFKYNPQAFSEFAYGSTQYWALLLELNNCKSRMDFNKREIRFYDPLRITEIMNLILLKESQLG